MADMQPGQVIIPHDSDAPGPGVPNDGSPEPDRPPEQPGPTPAPTPNPIPEPGTPPPVAEAAPVPPPSQPAPAAAEQPASGPDGGGWQFHQENAPVQAAPLPGGDLTWTASEFIEHHKSIGWYGLLALAGLAVTALDYFITKDKVSAGVIVLVTVVFGVYASNKPRTKEYNLSAQGLQIGQKFYGFQDFKTFSLIEEGANASIVLMPLKRFMPPLTIYVGPDMAEQVVGFLSTILPFERHRSDAVDGLLRRIHF